VIAPYRPHGPAPESETTLLVIAKPPLPGRVKTRLVPPCTPRQAAALAEAALADTQVRELGPVLDLASSACPGGTTARERQ
jgi:hypothetical protein